MLYVTTRNKHDAFTAYRTVLHDRGPDGGLYVPFHLPYLEKSQILSMAGNSLGQNMADILNLLFSTKLTAWDVDVTIGRNPIDFKPVGLRILMGELWHNVEGNFTRAVNGLAARLHPNGEKMGPTTNWVQIGIRIAALFGLYGQMLHKELVRTDKPLVLAVPAGDFSVPMAAWYARAMGLPIGTIVCGCNENGAPWDLLHRGALDTGMLAVNTTTPESDIAIPDNLERLICASIGQEEALHYWWACTEGDTYTPPEGSIDEIRKGLFAAVVSQDRVANMLSSVYRTNRYVLDPYSALAYGALTDYRSRTGSGATALIWMEKSPMCNAQLVASSMHISAAELKLRLAGK